MATDLYRVECATTHGLQLVNVPTGGAAPTTCPVDGGAIDPNQTVLLEAAASANLGVINESTPNQGVTVEGVLHKDGTVTTSAQAALVAGPYGTAAGQAGEVRWLELAANGTDYVAFKAPDALAASLTFTLPAADATNAYQTLVSNQAGVLSFQNAYGAAGPPGFALNFAADRRAYFEVRTTVNALITSFRYPGTGNHLTPTQIKVVASTTSASDSGTLQLNDVTNGQVVGTSAAFNTANTGTRIVVTVATLTNLPAAEAVFELVGKVTSGRMQVFHFELF